MLRVLLIEDDPSVRPAVVRMFRASFPDITVEVAASLSSARTILHNQKCDLVVLDGSLPNFDGGKAHHLSSLMLLDELEVGLSHRHDGPILAIAGSDEDNKVMMLHRKVTDSLQKPFSGPDLEAKIRKLLNLEDPSAA